VVVVLVAAGLASAPLDAVAAEKKKKTPKQGQQSKHGQPPKQADPAKPTPDAAPAKPPATPPVPVAPPAPVTVAASTAVEVPVYLRKHSVNGSFAGVRLFDYGVNYQWMFAPGHALLGELTWTYSDSEDSGRTMAVGAQAGYRFYFSRTQEGYFTGLLAGWDTGTTEAISSSTATVSTDLGPSSMTVTRRFQLPNSRWRVTAQLGRRWIIGPGLNLTARVGIGPGKRKFARGGDPVADRMAEDIEAIINFLPISLDAETSVGWVF